MSRSSVVLSQSPGVMAHNWCQSLAAISWYFLTLSSLSHTEFNLHIQPLRGCGPLLDSPQVLPGAIISLRSLLRFIFNPYGVVLPFLTLPRFHLGLLSRSARYYVSYSTPTGLCSPSWLSPGFTWGYSYSTPTGLMLFIISSGACQIDFKFVWVNNSIAIVRTYGPQMVSVYSLFVRDCRTVLLPLNKIC